MNRTHAGAFFVLLSTLCYGMTPIFAVYAYRGGAGITTVLFARFVLATGIFFAARLAMGRRTTVSRSHLGYLAVLGSVLFPLQAFLYFGSVKRISPSLVSLLVYTYPAFIVVLSFAFYRERPTRRTLASIGVSVCGLALVHGAGVARVDTLGALMAIGAALVYSFYILLSSHVLKTLPATEASAFVALFACPSLLVIGLATRSIRLDHIQPVAWGAIVGIAVFSTVVSVSAMFRGLQLVGSTRASTLSVVECLVTAGFSALLLHERLTWLQAAGGAAIMLAAVLVLSGRAEESG